MVKHKFLKNRINFKKYNLIDSLTGIRPMNKTRGSPPCMQAYGVLPLILFALPISKQYLYLLENVDFTQCH